MPGVHKGLLCCYIEWGVFEMGADASASPGARESRSHKKDERVAVRLPAKAKRMLEDAAATSGRSLTDFVVDSAMAAAQDTIENMERIRLALEDRAAFMAALANPPEPNAALQTAAARHQKPTG